MKTKKDLKEIVKYVLQVTPGMVTMETLNGVGTAQQSPFLSRIFDPSQNLSQFFNTMFKTAIVVGAMLAVLRLGYAGFKYMTSDLPGVKGNAREIISQALLGLLLLLSVWLILNQINPNILNLNILQNVNGTQGSAQQQGNVQVCFPQPDGTQICQ